MSRQAVVTGMGAIAPGAADTARLWMSALAGRGSLKRLARYPAAGYPLQVGGEVDTCDPADLVESRIVVQTDRYTHFGLAAAQLALRNAVLDPAALPPYAFGVVTASAAGGVEFGQKQIELLWSRGPREVGPYQSIAWFYAATTGQLSIAHGLKGPCGVVAADESGGLDALAHAARDLRRGTAAMLVGGGEAPFAPFSMACQYGHGLLSYAEDPDRAYLPFTADAAGFSPAEGGAVLTIEAREAAEERGAMPLAVVAGHGATHTGTLRLADSARGLERAARDALAEASCAPEEVDVVFADAFGVAEADRAEVEALHALFGPGAGGIPVTAPKAGYGRAYSCAALLDVVLAVLTLRYGLIPPTPYVTRTDYDIDLVVRVARQREARTALVLSRGISGGNSALVLRAEP